MFVNRDGKAKAWVGRNMATGPIADCPRIPSGLIDRHALSNRSEVGTQRHGRAIFETKRPHLNGRQRTRAASSLARKLLYGLPERETSSLLASVGGSLAARGIEKLWGFVGLFF